MKRIIIDELKESDKYNCFKNIANDKLVLETFVYEYCDDYNSYDFNRLLNNKNIFAIRFNKTKELIGIILYFEEKDEECEIGYAIGSSYWGNGYTTIAVKIFIKMLFDKGFNKIYASAFTENIASIKVMEKCGFSSIGRIEKYEYHNIVHDLVYYSLYKEK